MKKNILGRATVVAALILSAIGGATPALAQGPSPGPGTYRFGTEQSIVDFEFRMARTATVIGAGFGTVGTGGLLSLMSIADNQPNVWSSNPWGTGTATIATFLYPTKVVFSIYDVSANSTPSCTAGQFELEGLDQFGRKARESGSGTFSEASVIRSANVYSLLTKTRMRCADATGIDYNSGDDKFAVRADMRYVGLPVKIARKQDLISICRANRMAVSAAALLGGIVNGLDNTTTWACTTISNLGSLSATTLIDKSANSIFTGGIGLSVDATQGPKSGDLIRIRYLGTR